MIARAALLLLCSACGGTLSPEPVDAGSDAAPDVAPESGSTCAPPPACANARVIAGPVPLSTLLGKQDLVSFVATDCGYAFLTRQQDVLSAQPLSRHGDRFMLGTPYAIATGLTPTTSVLQTRSLRDTLFFRSDPNGSVHFFGPALGAASFDVVLLSDMPTYLSFYAAHDDRLLFLFEESPGNNVATLYWMEAARDGTITRALEPVPGGVANGYNAFSPGLVAYESGFAWFVPTDPQGHGTIFFSRSTGDVVEVAPAASSDFVPLTPWPYGAGVAYNGAPSSVVLDDGQLGIPLTRHIALFNSSDSSAELGILDASRWLFSQVDANGDASQVTYDGGKMLNTESFQPAPFLVIRGGEAVVANPEGNVIAVGCGP